MEKIGVPQEVGHGSQTEFGPSFHSLSDFFPHMTLNCFSSSSCGSKPLFSTFTTLSSCKNRLQIFFKIRRQLFKEPEADKRSAENKGRGDGC